MISSIKNKSLWIILFELFSFSSALNPDGHLSRLKLFSNSSHGQAMQLVTSFYYTVHIAPVQKTWNMTPLNRTVSTTEVLGEGGGGGIYGVIVHLVKAACMLFTLLLFVSEGSKHHFLWMEKCPPQLVIRYYKNLQHL